MRGFLSILAVSVWASAQIMTPIGFGPSVSSVSNTITYINTWQSNNFPHIGRTGSCSATGTGGCTLSASATGDLQVAFSYRSGSTSAPGNMSGWTSVATASTAAGGTTGAFRVMCRVSSTLATGSSSNSAGVTAVSYSGTTATTTAACASVLGGKATNHAQTSATADFPALTMTNANATSWVVGFIGDSAGGLCAPTGMGSVSTAGTGPAVQVNDTGGTVSSWSDQTCAVTSGTWMTYVAEILSTTCKDATTCSVKAAEAVAAGDDLDFSCSTVNIVVPTSVSAGGTLVDSYMRSGIGQSFGTNFYILNASAISSGDTVTVTFSGTTGGAHCDVVHFSHTGSGLALDAAGDFQDTPVSSPAVHVPVTQTSSLGLAIQSCFGSPPGGANTKCTAVGAPWTGIFTGDSDQTNQSIAYDSGVVSTPSTPSWTITGSNQGIFNGVLFGFNPTACVNYGILDFSGGTAGNKPAVADIQASMFGFTDTNAANNGFTMQVGVADTQNQMTYNTTAYQAIATAPRFCNGGATYSTPSTHLGFRITYGAVAATAKITFTLPGQNTSFPSPNAAASQVIVLHGFSGSGTYNIDAGEIQGGAAMINNFYIQPNGGNITGGMEHQAGCTPGTTSVILANDTPYLIQWLYVKGVKQEIVVSNWPAMTNVGTMTATDNGSTCVLSDTPLYFVTGDFLGATDSTGCPSCVLDYSAAKIAYVTGTTTEIPY